MRRGVLKCYISVYWMIRVYVNVVIVRNLHNIINIIDRFLQIGRFNIII